MLRSHCMTGKYTEVSSFFEYICIKTTYREEKHTPPLLHGVLIMSICTRQIDKILNKTIYRLIKKGVLASKHSLF